MEEKEGMGGVNGDGKNKIRIYLKKEKNYVKQVKKCKIKEMSKTMDLD